MIKASKKFIFVLSMFIYSNIYSQIETSDNKAKIEGIVIDNKTNETLLGANIRIIGGSGTTTNINGEFILQGIKKFPIKIECSYIGYETQLKEVKKNEKII